MVLGLDFILSYNDTAMKSIKKNLYKVSLLIYSVLMPFSLISADDCVAGSGKICNPIAANSIPDFIQTFLIKALELGIPVIALAVIYCGFLFVAARGNSEKLTKAKAALLYTLIGAAILLGAFAIATLIKNTVGALA